MNAVMQQALAPFVAAKLLGSVPQGALHFSAPPCPQDHIAIEFDAGLDEPLVCHLEYEAPERATRDEPGDPGLCALSAAYLRGVNVLPLLREGFRLVERIEQTALQPLREDV